MENILEISKLNKSYTDFSLTDVSFSLPDNSITGFIGVNGSGKTTTIRSILGLVKFNYGVIKLFGQDINKNIKTLKERVGVVLDEGGFYEEFSMSEMKGIVGGNYGRTQKIQNSDNSYCFNDYRVETLHPKSGCFNSCRHRYLFRCLFHR